jgi:predicted phage baseplate assembly protein
VRLVEAEWKNGHWEEKKAEWNWRMSFLGSPASRRYQRHYVLEDGQWDRVVGYRRSGKEIVHRDYASNDGKTIRFGDGEFGLRPGKGSVFEVSYRLGNGRRGNLAAESLTHFDPKKLSFVSAISNPIAVANGVEAETPGEVRQLAPDAFREVTYRAVRSKDYAEAAERLDWVQRAGARFRWTGSWLTAFVTPDPLGAVSLTQDQRRALTNQIDRFRQAGREAHVMAPRYADIDLRITVCVEPTAFPGQVKERVLEALLGRAELNKKGFFDPDNLTFGTPLRRSKLEAVIRQVAGVLAVRKIEIRRRGYFDWKMLTKPYFPVSDQDVIRLENDPNHPERGTLMLTMEGGA